ncbi:MAG: hypothetical protein Kow00120_28990 [Anaerolineae bacterium]
MCSWKWQRIALVLMLALAALPATALPAGAQANLLNNGSMENGFTDRFGDGNGVAPNGWEPWFVDQPSGCNNFRPVFTQSGPGQAQDGGAAAVIYLNYQTYTAGLKQNVNVAVGSTLRLTAYGRIISSDEKVGATTSSGDAQATMKIGIDPTGSGNPSSGAIVWSPSISATGGYQQFAVEATAQGGTVTVFLYSRPQWCFAENTTFFDAASLVVTGQGSANPNPGGGAVAPVQPENIPIQRAEPREDGSIVHVVQSGQYLNLIAGVYGVSVQQIQELNNLTGSIIFSGQELLIKPPDGAIEATQAAEEAADAEPTDPPPPTTPPQVADAGAVEPEVRTNGNLCVLAYKDDNRNAARDPGEGLLAGVSVTLTDGQQEQGRYTTSGVSPNEPYCFMNLPPGTYDLMMSGADLIATTPANVRLAVPAGQTVRVEYGAVSARAGATELDSGSTLSLDLSGLFASENASRIAAASIGAAGAVVFMTVLGAIIYLLFLRPRR